jgi:hypothetical protein
LLRIRLQTTKEHCWCWTYLYSVDDPVLSVSSSICGNHSYLKTRRRGDYLFYSYVRLTTWLTILNSHATSQKVVSSRPDGVNFFKTLLTTQSHLLLPTQSKQEQTIMALCIIIACKHNTHHIEPWRWRQTVSELSATPHKRGWLLKTILLYNVVLKDYNNICIDTTYSYCKPKTWQPVFSLIDWFSLILTIFRIIHGMDLTYSFGFQ